MKGKPRTEVEEYDFDVVVEKWAFYDQDAKTFLLSHMTSYLSLTCLLCHHMTKWVKICKNCTVYIKRTQYFAALYAYYSQ